MPRRTPSPGRLAHCRPERARVKRRAGCRTEPFVGLRSSIFTGQVRHRLARFGFQEMGHLGGEIVVRFSALYIAREKGWGASAEVTVWIRLGIVRRGVFRQSAKNEEVRSRAQRGNLPETRFSRFGQRESSGHSPSAGGRENHVWPECSISAGASGRRARLLRLTCAGR
jgi:hypothetical protein